MTALLSKKGIQKLTSTKHAAVLTGAGISSESGVPTFRGKNGLWKKFKPEELANFNAFISNPELVWEWYNYRKKLISEIRPNPGHFAIKAFEDHFEKFNLITQNIDGLHKLAGNKNVIELHGNIHRSYCIDCGKVYLKLKISKKGKIPYCDDCGGLIRPDVVWFGEMLPQKALSEAFRAAEECDLFFSIGTSGIVQPAASLPAIAKRHGAYLIEVNIEYTPISAIADESLLGKSGEILPWIVSHLPSGKNMQEIT